MFVNDGGDVAREGAPTFANILDDAPVVLDALSREVEGPIVVMGQAGPVPHLPENGKIVAFGPGSAGVATTLGSGAPLIVDVEFGPGLELYALSQGEFTPGNPEGSPANPDTGALVVLRRDGRLGVVVSQLNQPTSLEFIGDTAFVVTLGGEIWKIDNVSR